MLPIMACMDQKERHVVPCRKLRIFRSCCSSLVVDFLVVAQRQIPMVLFSKPSRFSCCIPLTR